MLDTTKIGDSIYAHRKRAGLTQRKLGELAMIGRSNISSHENGKIPCLYNAIAIAGAQYAASPDTPAAPGACGPALLLTLSELRAGRKMEIILCLLLLLEQLLAACIEGTKE